MKVHFYIGIACALAARLALADTGGPGPSGPTTVRQVALHIPDEMAPPGGVVQMKFMVTEPTPISSGGPRLRFSSTFDGVFGIELFNPTGDVNGAAVINGSQVNIFYTTSTGAQGSDYPIMTVALHVSPDAAVGTKTQFSLDPSSTWILGLLGPTTLKPTPPATVTVGGSISITNVVPGGGLLPAGSIVSIQGMGFEPRTQVQLNAIKAGSINVVNPGEIQFTLAQDTNMTGQKIQVTNPDGSQDTYFSYMRGIPLIESSRPLLQSTVPIFSTVTHSTAIYPVGVLLSNMFNGIALQNQNPAPATVTVSLYSLMNTPLGNSTINVPSGYRFIAETSELTHVAPPPGSYVVVSSTQPVQSFGFIADSNQSTLLPFGALFAQP
ncbi:MAG TPA: IPT/TIG domain-containing protein [Bryobacteraceae bacterium]|nr:IPT/TIG domain-containing protein [Bryobacteraceae bacterium]